MKIKSKTFFAYGPECEYARSLLSDGAFNVYMYIVTHAQRSNGRMPYRARGLAREEDRSLGAVNTYIHEMEEKGICVFRPPLNQYESGHLEICDVAWPYAKERGPEKTGEFESYKIAIREALQMRPCVLCRFSAADASFAERLFLRGITLVQITRALHLGCAAKYISLLNEPGGELISRLSYFRDVLEQVVKPASVAENWPLNAVVMTKYELGWCMAYLASATKIFRLTSCEVEQVLRMSIEEACALSNQRRLRELTEEQSARVSCITRIFTAAEHSRVVIGLDWFTTPNSNHVFGGQRPVDGMSTNNLEKLQVICRHIRSLAGY